MGGLEKLPTSLWLEIFLRRLNNKGIPYYYIQQGPKEGGAVILKVYVAGEGAQVFSQIRDMDGNLTWMESFENGWVDEREYCTRYHDTRNKINSRQYAGFSRP